MRGQILDYAVRTNSGVISTEDGSRFEFSGAEWKSANAPTRGAWVDFVHSGTTATEIYTALAQGAKQAGGRSKSTITLLALFLGIFGAHKFYMGAWGWGIIFLLISCFGGLAFGALPILIFMPFIATMIEVVRFILMTDNEFHAKLSEYKPSPFGNFW